MRNRIVFLGSKPTGFFCLEHLILNQDRYNIELLGVLTNNTDQMGPANLEALANEHNINLFHDLDEILETECEFLISIQFHMILKKEHISIAKNKAINLHMAPLPEYRGCNQFTFAILDEKIEFGTTIHIMDEGIDSGDILAEKRFQIPDQCFVTELYDLTFKASCDLFENRIGDILSDNCTATPQKDYEGIRTSSIHYRKDIAGVKQIDLSWDQEKIWRHVRATSMPGFDPPYALVDGNKIEFVLK